MTVGHPKPPKREKKAPKPIPRGKPIARSRVRIARKKRSIRKSPYLHPVWRALNLAFILFWVALYGRDICGECRETDAEATHHLRYAKGRGWRRLVVPFAWLMRVCHECHGRIETLKQRAKDEAKRQSATRLSTAERAVYMGSGDDCHE